METGKVFKEFLLIWNFQFIHVCLKLHVNCLCFIQIISLPESFDICSVFFIVLFEFLKIFLKLVEHCTQTSECSPGVQPDREILQCATTQTQVQILSKCSNYRSSSKYCMLLVKHRQSKHSCNETSFIAKLVLFHLS